MKTYNQRRGMGIGRGVGYYNIAPMDSHIHSLSARGVKQTSGVFHVTGAVQKDLKLKQIGGDVNWKDYDGTFIVPEKFNNGDFDYWLVIKFTNLEEAMGSDAPAKYNVEIQAVAPSQLTKEQIKRAIEQDVGDDPEQEKKLLNNKEALVGSLADYGLSATLYSAQGDNADELMKDAKTQITGITGMFGFYMDKQANRLGNTGWDFIKGDIGFKK